MGSQTKEKNCRADSELGVPHGPDRRVIMSQYLVAIWNETARDISISNTEADNAAKIPAGQAVIVQGRHGHWNIPDCSADKYFKDHHMAIQEVGGTILYCFWGDDS